MMKLNRLKLPVCCLLMLMLVVMAGCEAIANNVVNREEIDEIMTVTENDDADLVVEKYFEQGENDKGILHTMFYLHWQQGVLQYMRVSQEYDTAEHAEASSLSKIEELGDFGNVVLDGVNLSYNVGIENLVDKSYRDVVRAFVHGGEWTVVEELSGIYPTEAVADEETAE